MADMEQQQQVIMLDASTFADHTEIVTVSQDSNVVVKEVSDDILQQALDEVSNGFEEKSVEYVTEQSVPVDSVVVTEANAHGNVDSVGIGDENATTFAFVTSDNDTQVIQELQTEEPQQHVQEQQQQQQHTLLTENGNTTVLLNDSSIQIGAQQLGSSVNPIRIIQQGNQYTSMQQLTPEQLTQIMQVVQQQQLAKSAEKGGGSSILFNPQTQTRIVYRVIYPSELHQNCTSLLQTSKQLNSDLKSQVVKFSNEPPQKRVYRKRNRDEDEKLDGPELSKEEKAERKKHRPRTRSGRVSKPPKHMVKDYKHIHVLDWDEDYDDSDGGYSDIQQSDEEDERRSKERIKKEDQSFTVTGMPTLKPRNHKCEMCGKCYIGRAGLGRHYKMTGHGILDKEPAESFAKNPIPGSTNGIDSQGDDSSTQSSIASPAPLVSQPLTFVSSNFTPSTTAPAALTNANVTMSNVTLTRAGTPGRKPANHVPKAAIRIKNAYMSENTPTKRKMKLKDLVRQCEDEELMEVVLPRLAKVITCWEFLIMKVEKGRPLKPHFPDVYREFEMLHRQVQKMCQDFLFVKQNQNLTDVNSPDRLQISNETVAKSLGLSVGTFDVREPPVQDENTAFQYKLLTTDPTSLSGSTPTTKRTVQLVSADELVVQAKKPRFATAVTSVANDISTLAPISSTTAPLVNLETQGREMKSLIGAGTNDHVKFVIQNGNVDHEEVETLRTKTSGEVGGVSEESELVIFDQSHELNTKEHSTAKDLPEDESQNEPVNVEYHTVSQSDLGEDPTSHTKNVDEPKTNDESSSSEQCNLEQSIADSEQIQQTKDVPSSVDTDVSNEAGSESTRLVQQPAAALVENVTVHQDENIQLVYQSVPIQQNENASVETMHSGGSHTALYENKDSVQINLTVQSDSVAQNPVESVNEQQHREEVVHQVMTPDPDPMSMDQVTTEGHSVVVSNHNKDMVITTSEEIVKQSDDDCGSMQGMIVNMDQECYVQDQDVESTQVLIQEGQMLDVGTHSRIIQTPDGLLFLQNPDGTMFQLQHNDQDIPLETVQALLAMESETLVHTEQVIDNEEEQQQ